MLSYIRKNLFIFLFLLCKYESINLPNRKFVLNVKGNSDNLYFYYITLLLGKEKQSQSFILDTTSSITTSPCNFCISCGDHMNDYYIINSNNSIIDINSEECKSLPNILDPSTTLKNNQLDKKNCYFSAKIENDQILGLYSYKFVSFESITSEINNEDELNNYVLKEEEFQLPLGCSLKETGFLMSSLSDGIIGLNNNDKSFVSMMYRKELIPNNLFTLCLNKEGGYFSLGDIDTKYHICSEIKYVEYIPSSEIYELESEKIIINNNEIPTKYTSIIDSSSTISYFPEEIFNNISMAFFMICSEYEGQCGKLKRIEGYGICSDFKNSENYLNAIKYILPIIQIKFRNYTFNWEPKNYLLNFYFKNIKNKIRTCFGIDTEKNLNKIILGTNFMHGYDIIFDRTNYKIGFCEASCSRNMTEKNEIISRKSKIEEEMNISRNETKDKNKNDKKYFINDLHNKYNYPNYEKDKIIEGKNKNIKKNVDRQYYKYLIFSLITIFILLIFFILGNNYYNKNIISKRQIHLDKNNLIHSHFNQIKDVNKENLSTQKIELIETNESHNYHN